MLIILMLLYVLNVAKMDEYTFITSILSYGFFMDEWIWIYGRCNLNNYTWVMQNWSIKPTIISTSNHDLQKKEYFRANNVNK